MAVEQASASPCAAKRSISERTRRWASIANASSSRIAASRLMSCAYSGRAALILGAQKQVDQHAKHREHECGTEELRSAEDAHLRRQRLDQRQCCAAEQQLHDE